MYRIIRSIRSIRRSYNVFQRLITLIAKKSHIFPFVFPRVTVVLSTMVSVRKKMLENNNRRPIC